MFKKLTGTGIILLIVVLIAVFILPKLLKETEVEGKSETSGRSGKPMEVRGLILKPQQFQEKINTTGSLQAFEEVELRIETSGRITGIYFSEGDYVNEGKLLLKVNDAELQAQLKKAELRKQILADKEYRQRMLLSKNATSQEVYDAALNELNGVDADIELLKAQINKTEIRAPFNGIVGLRYVSVGAFINSSTKIALFQRLDQIKIDFSIPERYFGSVKSGSSITFSLQGSEKKYQARIYAVQPKVDVETRTLQLRGVISNPRREIPTGAFVKIELELNKSSNALLVPSIAVVPDITGHKIFLYKSGKVFPVTIDIGARNESNVQILAGAKIGDTVIVSGIVNMRPNAPVTISTIE
jgi:membrane fusion protein (multidrug efflux system)